MGAAYKTAPWSQDEFAELSRALMNGAEQRDLRAWFPDRSPYAIAIAVQRHDKLLVRRANGNPHSPRSE